MFWNYAWANSWSSPDIEEKSLSGTELIEYNQGDAVVQLEVGR